MQAIELTLCTRKIDEKSSDITEGCKNILHLILRISALVYEAPDS